MRKIIFADVFQVTEEKRGWWQPARRAEVDECEFLGACAEQVQEQGEVFPRGQITVHE